MICKAMFKDHRGISNEVAILQFIFHKWLDDTTAVCCFRDGRIIVVKYHLLTVIPSSVFTPS